MQFKIARRSIWFSAAGWGTHESILSKRGNDLRQSFRTLATVAGISEFDSQLLMNHAIPGVNAGYLTRHKLFGDHLRGEQQAISNVFFGALGSARSEVESIRDWLGPGAVRRQFERSPALYDRRAHPSSPPLPRKRHA